MWVLSIRIKRKLPKRPKALSKFNKKARCKNRAFLCHISIGVIGQIQETVLPFPRKDEQGELCRIRLNR